MRDDLERGVDTAQDPVRDEALDERDLAHALDGLQTVANELR